MGVIVVVGVGKRAAVRPEGYDSTANEPTVTVDPCTGYLGEIERTGRPDRFARFASMHSMGTVDFWHLYSDLP